MNCVERHEGMIIEVIYTTWQLRNFSLKKANLTVFSIKINIFIIRKVGKLKL